MLQLRLLSRTELRDALEIAQMRVQFGAKARERKAAAEEIASIRRELAIRDHAAANHGMRRASRPRGGDA